MFGGQSSWFPFFHLAAWPGCQARSWCRDANTLVFPLFGNSPAATLLDLPRVHLCPISQGTFGIQVPTGAFGTWGQQEPAGTWVPWGWWRALWKDRAVWKVSRHSLPTAPPVPAPRQLWLHMCLRASLSGLFDAESRSNPHQLCMLQMASGDVCFPWSGSGACLYLAAGRPCSARVLELCGLSR